MGQPHKHAELIKAWADGAEIQCEISQGNWCDIGKPDWHEEVKFRIKPEPPKYPKTRMTHEQIYTIWSKQKETLQGGDLEAVANAAIARAIEDGQVVLPKVLFDAGFIEINIVGDPGSRKWIFPDMVPAAMLEKVAEAVRSELVTQVAHYSTGCSTYINGEIDLAAIVKRAKEGKL